MCTRDEDIDVGFLERHLLQGSTSSEHSADEDDSVLYSASFGEGESSDFVKFKTAQWILYSVVLILAWGIGILMLLYLPFHVYLMRKELRSRKLYMTPNAIVYKVAKPVLPCFGVSKKEKHILLSSISDIVLEQGYLQSIFNIYSIRIEHVGIRKPSNYDVQIHGVADPRAFQKAVLMHVSSIRGEGFNRQTSTLEDPGFTDPSKSWMPIPGDLVMQKLEEVEISVKKLQMFMERTSGVRS